MPFAAATLLSFAAAALAEIAGCFAFWMWWRQGESVLWLIPGLLALALFAWLLALTPSDYAGRAYAAYGGIYIAASLLWLWLVERRPPDIWDLTGGGLAIGAAMIILFAPRG